VKRKKVKIFIPNAKIQMSIFFSGLLVDYIERLGIFSLVWGKGVTQFNAKVAFLSFTRWSTVKAEPSRYGLGLGLHVHLLSYVCLSIKASKKRLLTFTSNRNLSLSYAIFITIFIYQRCVLHM
jgi:hypothetical protein